MRNLGIVFSSRIQSFLLGLLGLWVIFFAITSAWQLVSSYMSTQRFDTPVAVVIVVNLLLFLPYLLTTGYMLRSLTARIAFYRLLRRQIVIAEYKPPKILSPAEAGVLVDDDFSLRELSGTLKNLELRGNISAEWTKGGQLALTLLHTKNLSPIEANFISNLFWQQKSLSTGNPDGVSRLLGAGHALAADTRNQLVLTGQIPPKPAYTKVLRGAFKIFVAVAIFVQFLLTLGMVQSPEEVLNVINNDYPMHWSEPVSYITIIAASLALVVSGFWVRKLTDSNGLKNWRYVAGLKLYLEVVYKNKFYRDGRLTVSEQELRDFYPYAIALGIEEDSTERLARALLKT